MFAFLKGQRGQDLVEYALIAPILFMLVLGTIDIANMVFSYDTISNAAREGARYGVIHPSDTTGITTQALNLTEGLQQASIQIDVSYPGGNTIQVKVIYDDPLFTGFLMSAVGGDSSMRLRASSTMQIE
jgi:Flp pilus assembly protein TadG